MVYLGVHHARTCKGRGSLPALVWKHEIWVMESVVARHSAIYVILGYLDA